MREVGSWPSNAEGFRPMRKSRQVWVMAWCRLATTHHLRQCWPKSLSPYGITGPHQVNLLKKSSAGILNYFVKILTCPANICMHPGKLIYTAGKICACLKMTGPVGHATCLRALGEYLHALGMQIYTSMLTPDWLTIHCKSTKYFVTHSSQCGTVMQSTLVQVMAWCLMAPSHYLNQCWLIISNQ